MLLHYQDQSERRLNLHDDERGELKRSYDSGNYNHNVLNLSKEGQRTRIPAVSR